MYDLFRPHLKHRLTTLEANLGFFCDLAIVDVFAINKIQAFKKLGVILAERALEVNRLTKVALRILRTGLTNKDKYKKRAIARTQQLDNPSLS